MNTDRPAPTTIDAYIAGFPPHVQELLQKKYTTIDGYIRQFEPEVREKLERVRKVIREAAPDAVEKISYQMPTFRLEGNLVHFAAFQSHIGLYPTPSGTERFREELALYETGKGSIRFPLDRPIPYDLITRIVKFRAKENRQRAEARRGKSTRTRTPGTRGKRPG